jgi:biopolymer transport protein ExbD
MGMSLGGNAGQKAQINVTPMIDVLLVLIIIFMVITPLAPTGLKTLVPQPAQAEATQPAPSDDVVVSVGADRSIRLNQQPVELANLQSRLADLFKRAPSHVLFVRGDRSLEFRDIAAVIDVARGAGLERIALMTE